MKKIKYKNRFKKKVCPVCGCNRFVYINHHVEYPEIWTETYCYDCGCTVEYEDNSLPQTIWDYISESGVRSKKKVLDEIRSFYYSNKEIKKIL